MRRRAVFHDAEDAHAVAARLRAAGFEADAGKEPFAGEDDDEDHAWAVITDAPAVMLELLAEERGGWLEDDGPGRPSAGRPPPLDLPDGPRRKKGHWPS